MSESVACTVPVPRVVSAGRGLSWLGDGWRMFMAEPGVWVGITAVLVLLQVLSNVLPLAGPLAWSLLTPVLFGGLMTGCVALAEDRELEFVSLFAGFRRRTGPLVMVGVLYLAGWIAILFIAMGVIFAAGGTAVVSALLQGAMNSPEAIRALITGSLIAVLLGLLTSLLLMLPLLMAWWFAPALVMLDEVPALAAMQSSLRACLCNWLPLTVYGLVVVVFMVLAAIPLMLGFLVLIPVLIASLYASYRDIYHA